MTDRERVKILGRALKHFASPKSWGKVLECAYRGPDLVPAQRARNALRKAGLKYPKEWDEE